MSRKDLREFEADVVCPRCSGKFGVYALLKPEETDYPVTCPSCMMDFQLGLEWTMKGIEAEVQRKKSMVDDLRLRRAINRGRPHRKVVLRWFLSNFLAWFAAGFVFIPLVILIGVLEGNWGFPVFGLFLYWVIGMLVSAILAELTYGNYKFRFKPDGVTVESGILMMNSASVPYAKIQEIRTNQGLLDSMIGLTNIRIQTAGTITLPTPYNVSSAFTIQGITDPKPMVDFLMGKANLPVKTHVENKVSTEEENSQAILDELVRIRSATEVGKKKARKVVTVDNVP